MISRRALLAAAGGAPLAGAQRRRPNILVLMPDQWRAADLGAMGNAEVRTPHMDALARGGALLRNVTANCPVCCPARATLLTGRYGHEHGVAVNDAPLPDSEVTVAEVAAASGYRTGFVGKWHLEGGRRQPGYVRPSRRQGFQFWAANICAHSYWDMHYFRDSPEPIKMEGYSASTFTDEAIEFVRGDPETPFLACVQWGPPHNPYVAPAEYMEMYDPQQLTMRPNWRGPARTRRRARGSREDIAGYYAAITFLDDEVGRIVAALRETGQLDRTIILVTSDHGDMLGSQGTVLKRKPWAESLHVPGIVHYPAGVAPGQVARWPFSHVDAAPTLLGLAGLPVPSGVSGRDLSGHLLRPGLGGRDAALPAAAYAQSYTASEGGEFPPWRAVRTERHTYARSESGPWLLYDNDSDPYQLRNLAGVAGHARLQARLDALTMEWFRRTGDDWTERSDLPYR